MSKPFIFHRLAILSIALAAAPALLQGGANTWTGSRPSGAPLTEPTLVVSAAADPDIVYSAQNGNLFGSSNGGRTWARIASFEFIYALYVHPTSTSTLFVGALRSGSLAGIFKSVDGGATWTQTLTGAGVHLFVNIFAGNSAHPSTIYASTSGGIYRSDDGGETWGAPTRPSSEDIRLSQMIAALIIDPADGTTLDVGGYDYAYPSYFPLAPFFRTNADAGESWIDLSTGLGSSGGVSAIAVDAAHPSTIFLGMYSNPASAVFHSTDGGATWSSAVGGLPADTEVSGLVMDPQDPLTLYASTNLGIYRTRDAGGSWHSLSQLLSGSAAGSLSLDSLVQDAHDRILRVGNSFGTFQLEIGAGALDVAAGAGRSHVLSWEADSLTVQTLDDSGQESNTPPEGPSGSWLAAAIADGADGLSRVLWVNGDGRAALEIVGESGSQGVFRFAGPADHAPADVSVGTDGSAHILWTSTTGAMFLASVDASGNATVGPAYGPYGDWTAIAVADSSDGSTWVLWRATDGRFSISVHHGLAMGEVVRLAPITDRAAEDITVATDGKLRVLLVGADNVAEVATVDASGHLTDVQNHSPGWRPRRISAGPDGLTRLLFSDGSGAARVFLLNRDNTVQAAPEERRQFPKRTLMTFSETASRSPERD